jgi:hypothetical protein
MSDKTKLAWLVGLIAVALLVWYFNSKVRSTIASNSSLSVDERSFKPLGIENPELQREILKHSRETEYKTSGRDLFTGFAPPPPEPPKNDQANLQQGPVMASPPPPLALPPSMKFFGYGTVPNGTARRAFLADGDEIYIVGEGDTLLGKFRVVKIGNANLDFEEIATGRRGSANLSEEQAAAPAS